MTPRDLLRGPAPAWPPPVDAVFELWARAGPRVRTLVRAATAVVVVLAVSGGLTRGPWGAPVEVVVTRVDVAAGGPIDTTQLAVTTRPADLVPASALRSLDQLHPTAVAAGRLPAGSVVTAEHLVADRTALAPTGYVVLPVDATLLPPLAVGTWLDLAVTSFDGTAALVANDAVVVADDGAWRWVAVPRHAAADVATGVSDGTLVPAVLPPRPAGAPSRGR